MTVASQEAPVWSYRDRVALGRRDTPALSQQACVCSAELVDSHDVIWLAVMSCTTLYHAVVYYTKNTKVYYTML